MPVDCTTDSAEGQCESAAADTTLPCITQQTNTTSVLDFSHLDTDTLDPDDPQPVGQEGGQIENLENARIRLDNGESETSHMYVIGQGMRQENSITVTNQNRSGNAAIDSEMRASNFAMDTQIKLENVTVDANQLKSNGSTTDSPMRPDNFTLNSQMIKLEGKVSLLENHVVENLGNVTVTATGKQEPTKRTSGKARPVNHNKGELLIYFNTVEKTQYQ